MELVTQKTSKAFGGLVRYCTHRAVTTNCDMTFGLFEPGSLTVEHPEKVRPMLWLSGLTCSHENFLTKAAALRFANEHGILLIVPDTSPRGYPLPGDSEGWDFGVGAGFYLNATETPWREHYRMYDYIVSELIPLVLGEYCLEGVRIPILGMGGHGALVLGLRNPSMFSSISAFAPILNPKNCSWGVKAFSGYLGEDSTKWDQYDATCLVLDSQGAQLPLFIDQGEADEFLESQLGLTAFSAACQEMQRPVTIKRRAGYDHGYYFVATFIEEHLTWHLNEFEVQARARLHIA